LTLRRKLRVKATAEESQAFVLVKLIAISLGEPVVLHNLSALRDRDDEKKNLLINQPPIISPATSFIQRTDETSSFSTIYQMALR
jgi:hypothetical protein